MGGNGRAPGAQAKKQNEGGGNVNKDGRNDMVGSGGRQRTRYGGDPLAIRIVIIINLSGV